MLNLATRKPKTEHDILSDEAKWEDWQARRYGIVTTGGLIDVLGRSCVRRRIGTPIRPVCG
jgi:hypothetical protein